MNTEREDVEIKVLSPSDWKVDSIFKKKTSKKTKLIELLGKDTKMEWWPAD